MRHGATDRTLLPAIKPPPYQKDPKDTIPELEKELRWRYENVRDEETGVIYTDHAKAIDSIERRIRRIRDLTEWHNGAANEAGSADVWGVNQVSDTTDRFKEKDSDYNSYKKWGWIGKIGGLFAVGRSAGNIPRIAATKKEIARRNALGYDPAIKKVRPLEKGISAQLELEEKLKLQRRQPPQNGDWHDQNGQVYDALGPVPNPSKMKTEEFIKSITGHLEKRVTLPKDSSEALDSIPKIYKIPVYLNGMSPEQKNAIMNISIAFQQKIGNESC